MAHSTVTYGPLGAAQRTSMVSLRPYVPHLVLAGALTIFWIGVYRDVFAGGPRGASFAWLLLGAVFVGIVLELQWHASHELSKSDRGPARAMIAIYAVMLALNIVVLPLDLIRNGITMSPFDYACYGAIAVTAVPLIAWKGIRFFATGTGRSILAVILRGIPQLMLAGSFVLAGGNRMSAATVVGLCIVGSSRLIPVLVQWRKVHGASLPVLIAELGNVLTIVPIAVVWWIQL